MSIQVFLVDDSAVVREVLKEILEAVPDIKLMGSASDPIVAMARLKFIWPDVFVLDINMPRMDGLTFVQHIMRERPTPVVIFSSLTSRGARVSMEVLAAGALSVVSKPLGDLKEAGPALIQELRSAALACLPAALVHPKPSEQPLKQPSKFLRTNFNDTPTPKLNADVMMDLPTGKLLAGSSDQLIVIGASTGGPQALEFILRALTPDCPPVAIVQHMPEGFTQAFADRLNTVCAIEAMEARDGDELLPGRALIAQGGKHLMVRRRGRGYWVEVKDGPAVSRHRPSVDVLFRSTASSAGPNATAVILTGMGDDGARGMWEMRQAGACTVAQDQDSCVVFGMPKEAIAREAADQVLPLKQIAQTLAMLRKS